jgi:hypothetical protein
MSAPPRAQAHEQAPRCARPFGPRGIDYRSARQRGAGAVQAHAPGSRFWKNVAPGCARCPEDLRLTGLQVIAAVLPRGHHPTVQLIV